MGKLPPGDPGPEERTAATHISAGHAALVAKRPFVLEMVRGPGSPRRYILDRDQFVIGRSDAVDLRVESEELSRRHAQLTKGEGEYVCLDLDSRNGVYLNGVKIHSATLRDGDQLQLGGVVFIYREGD